MIVMMFPYLQSSISVVCCKMFCDALLRLNFQEKSYNINNKNVFDAEEFVKIHLEFWYSTPAVSQPFPYLLIKTG